MCFTGFYRNVLSQLQMLLLYSWSLPLLRSVAISTILVSGTCVLDTNGCTRAVGIISIGTLCDYSGDISQSPR